MPLDQLDIEKIYELAENPSTDDLYQIAREIETTYDSSQTYLSELACKWDQNVHFYEGDQHLYYNKTTRRFEQIPTTKFNKFIPRPVTNFVFPITQTINSVMTKNKPQASVRENSDKADDVNRAKIGDAVLDAKWEMDNEQLLHVQAAKIAELCGTVYRKDYWDITGLGYVNVPGSKKQIPLGDNAVRMFSPFEVVPDLSEITDVQKGYFIFEASVQTLNWIKESFSKDQKGATGLAEDVRENTDLSTLLSYSERLKGSTGESGQSGDTVFLKNSAIVLECYLKPIKKFPKGLMIVVSDGKTIYIGESPYTYNDGKNWNPYTEFKYDVHPFRHHGISLVEQIVRQQKRINAIDSLIILNRMQMASPQWLIPKGCEIPDGYISGAPALNIWYVPIAGFKPEKIFGVPLDSSVYQERSNAIMEMHQIAGDNEVLSGSQPSGVNTASALNLLLEQSFSKFSPMIQHWEKFIEKGQIKKLNLIRRKYKEPREEFTNRLKVMNKDNLTVEINDFFTGQDLGDNIDVRVEAGSSLPRSKVVEQSQLQELAGTGVLGQLDPLNNPLGNAEFLRKFGITDFPTNLSVDVERASWENDMLRQSQQVFVLEDDDDNLHIKIHTDETKKPEYFTKTPENVQQATYTHIQEHKSNIQRQQAEAKQQAQPMAANNIPAPGPGTPSGAGGEPPLPPLGGQGMI